MTGKELFIRFTASAFCKLLSIYVFSYFPFRFEGGMWGLIVSVPGHCLSFYFTSLIKYKQMLVTTIKIIILCMFGDTNCNILASLLN